MLGSGHRRREVNRALSRAAEANLEPYMDFTDGLREDASHCDVGGAEDEHKDTEMQEVEVCDDLWRRSVRLVATLLPAEGQTPH